MAFERITEDPEKKHIKNEAAKLLWDAVNSLSERQRIVVEEHIIKGKTYPEIDTELGFKRGRSQQIGINAKRHLRAKTVLRLIKDDLTD